MKKFDPFKNLVLDKEEQEIEEALKKGEYRSDPDFKKNKKMFEEAAKNFLELQKTKRITLRVNSGDLLKVKSKAKRVRIPYQRLLNALIHRYADSEISISI